MEAPTTDPDRPRPAARRAGVACEVVGAEPWLAGAEITRMRELAQSAAGMVFGDGAAGQIGVRVVDDALMSEAHQRYSGVPGTTDVLTFDLGADVGDRSDGGPREVGVDLLVCGDVAAREASARGTGVMLELLLYVVHGMLHCAGYDDHSDEAARAMHAREDEILARLGVGPVYSAAGGGGGS